MGIGIVATSFAQTDTDLDGLRDDVDVVPDTPTNLCGATAEFKQQTASDGSHIQCAAAYQVNVKPSLLIEPNGRADVYAPEASIKPGFTVPMGGVFSVTIAPAEGIEADCDDTAVGSTDAPPPMGFIDFTIERAFPNLSLPRTVDLDGTEFDEDHLYATDLNGRVLRFEARENITSVETTVFLDITDRTRANQEQGLLSFAFDPNYRSNGYIYVHYSANANPNVANGDTVISRFTADPSTGTADATTEVELLRFPQPFNNNNGGDLAFGPDGMLYISSGDGGGSNDPQDNAQNLGNLYGKILRIRADGSIPDDNPFVGQAGARGEIWAYGFRGPFRFSFDKTYGRLWTGEVGQSEQEIDLIRGCGNYGWSVYEGESANKNPNNLPFEDFDPPVIAYPSSLGVGVIGGVVYRGNEFPQLTGRYFYGDITTTRIWSVSEHNGKAVENIQIGNITGPLSVGVDLNGEPLFTTAGGNLFRLTRVDDNADIQTTVHSGPDSVTQETDAAFTFTANKPATFECRLTGPDGSSAWEPCSSVVSYTDLVDGDYVFQIRATDEAGNVEDPPAEWRWTIDVIRLAAADQHGCLISEDRTLWCWGTNGYGQLGDGTRIDRTEPTRIGIESDWIAIATGESHSCAIRLNGSLWCWGRNNAGQLGLGDDALPMINTPTQVGDDTWQAVTAGAFHSCGIQEDGGLFCWGDNAVSQLAQGDDSSFTPEHAPVQVSNETNWLQLNSGQRHACALNSDAVLACWGANGHGQIGNGNQEHQTSPQPLSDTWKVLSMGQRHSCALRDNDELYCWGANESGQLGVDSRDDANQPQQIIAPTGFTWSKVFTGAQHSCATAIDDNDSEQINLLCWGLNDHGQLGVGSNDDVLTPTLVEGNPWRTMTGGGRHSCGLHQDKTLLCWGQRLVGQLGDQSQVNSSDTLLPKRIGMDTNWQAPMSVGGTHACATNEAGLLQCWGRNVAGELGDGTRRSRTRPALELAPSAEFVWSGISAGTQHGCAHEFNATTDRGNLYCWGDSSADRTGLAADSDNLEPTLLLPPPTLNVGLQTYTFSQWISFTAGARHGCGVAMYKENTDDTQRLYPLYCWGDNRHRQLGTGSTEDELPLSPVGDATNWRQVTAGDTHSCAIDDSDTLYCWGRNNRGQLGLGNNSDAATPTAVGSDTWASVIAASHHSCSINQSGSAWCWGANESAQLGLGDLIDRRTPVRIDPNNDWTSLHAFARHGCGIRGSGTLWCWGDNRFGQLGLDDRQRRTQPTTIGSITDWAAIEVGSEHSCGVRQNGELLCWGRNFHGQLGDAQAWIDTPQAISLPTGNQP